MWEYDTDLESDEPWVDTGSTKDETLDNLQQFTNTKLQKETVVISIYIFLISLK